jgi:hypothetical protein
LTSLGIVWRSSVWLSSEKWPEFVDHLKMDLICNVLVALSLPVCATKNGLTFEGVQKVTRGAICLKIVNGLQNCKWIAKL